MYTPGNELVLPLYESNGCSYLDQISVGIIKAYDLLSPAVCHKLVDILHIGKYSLQLFHKALYIRFFKIQFTGIIL